MQTLAAGVIEETQKQNTDWTAIIMFTIFVGASLWITKWAAKRTRSAADFYTAGGILLNTAERVCCPDIAYLCSYDSKLTARQMLSRLQDCCVEICNHVQFLKHSHNDALQKNILDWLAQNFQNPEINAAMTAEQFKISKKYLSQFLKEQTGKSYTEYVEELRLDHAMQLLRTTDLNITDIAEQCGFSTATTFYKAFRRKYQLSPSAVRKGDN